MVASLSLLVVGCGDTAPVSGNNSTPSDKPVDGGTVTFGYGITQLNDTLMPGIAGDAFNASLAMMAFDPLMYIDYKQQILPDLASKWTWSDDNKVLTFTLANAKWSDGQPITSSDVLFTINMFASPDFNQGGNGTALSSVKGYDAVTSGKAKSFADTGGFKRVSDTEFQFVFTQADPAALQSIAGIMPVPEHVLKNTSFKDMLNSDYDKMPTVVSGPFQFKSVHLPSTVELAANDQYFKGKPHISTINIKGVSTDVAPGMLANGTIDFMYKGFKLTDVNNLKKISNIQVQTSLNDGWSYMGLKLRKPEFKDIKVRQAIAYGLNRQQMVQGILKGYGVTENSPIPPIQWAAATEKDGLNPYNYDPNKANQLLDEAGWKKGSDGMRIDPTTGKTAELHLSYATGSSQNDAEAVAIQQDLQKVGLKVVLNQPLDSNAMYAKVRADDPGVDMWLGGWGGLSDDPRGLWQSTDSSNWARWADPKNMQLIADTYGTQAFDQNYRKQALIKWQLYVNEQLPNIFLFDSDLVVVVGKRLHIPQQDTTGELMNMQDWWATN